MSADMRAKADKQIDAMARAMHLAFWLTIYKSKDEAETAQQVANDTFEACRKKLSAMADAARAALARHAAAAGAGDGWQVVPKEPTEPMMAAGQRYLNGRVSAISPSGFDLPATFRWHEFWTAMLAASPPAPTQGETR